MRDATLDRDQILERLREIIEGELCDDMENIKGTDDLWENLGADSLDIVNILMGVEEVFEVSISDEEGMDARTVNDLVGLIERKLKEP